MKTFKTPKGTELPLADIKGKDYLLVPHRVQWFREEFPFGRISTALVESSEKHAMYKATIAVPWDNDYRILATATKREDAGHFPDFHEKAETGAIGRALALCGYGTQFAHELEEGNRIVDAPLQKTFLVPPGRDIRDLGQQPMPQAAASPKPQQNESLNIVALGNRVFSIAPWNGLKFKDLAFGQKQEAFDYTKWCKGELKTKGLDKCHVDMRQWVQYMEMIQSN